MERMGWVWDVEIQAGSKTWWLCSDLNADRAPQDFLQEAGPWMEGLSHNKAIKNWHSLPREVVDAPKSEVRLNEEQPDLAEDVPAGRLD